MARVNVTIHGEEDVSTASQKVRSSLHDLKEKAKEATAPFKDFTDTIKTVAGLGGAAVVLRQIYGEMKEMEQAFAKMHPELQKTEGSLQAWTAASTDLKAALGSLVAGALSPLRAVLIDMIQPWTDNINGALQLAAVINQLKGSTDPARLALAAQLDALRAEKEAVQEAGKMAGLEQFGSNFAAALSGGKLYLTPGAAEAGAEAQVAANRRIAELDAEIAKLEEQLKKGLETANTLMKTGGTSTAAGGSPKGAAEPIVQTLQDLAKFDMGIAAALRSMASAGGNGSFWALNAPGQNLIPEGFEDPTAYATLMAEKFAIALPSAFAMGQFGDIRRVDAALGEYTLAPPEPTMLQRAGAGLGDLWSGGTTGSMFAQGGDAIGGLVDAISPLLASFASLQSLLDPVSVILKAMFDALQPLIDSLLAPLIGILTIIGQTLAATIAPLLKFLAPIIDWIGKAFVWLYNNAIVPIGNAFIHIYTALTALATLIFYIVTFQWGKIGGISWSPDEGSLLKPITTGSLTSTTGTEGYGGSSTNVIKPPDIYIYQTFEGPVIGEGGMVQVGKFTVEGIEAYLGTGARVHFLEAP
jgi:hypothetical protein